MPSPDQHPQTPLIPDNIILAGEQKTFKKPSFVQPGGARGPFSGERKKLRIPPGPIKWVNGQGVRQNDMPGTRPPRGGSRPGGTPGTGRLPIRSQYRPGPPPPRGSGGPPGGSGGRSRPGGPLGGERVAAPKAAKSGFKLGRGKIALLAGAGAAGAAGTAYAVHRAREKKAIVKNSDPIRQLSKSVETDLLDNKRRRKEIAAGGVVGAAGGGAGGLVVGGPRYAAGGAILGGVTGGLIARKRAPKKKVIVKNSDPFGISKGLFSKPGIKVSRGASKWQKAKAAGGRTRANAGGTFSKPAARRADGELGDLGMTQGKFGQRSPKQKVARNPETTGANAYLGFVGGSLAGAGVGDAIYGQQARRDGRTLGRYHQAKHKEAIGKALKAPKRPILITDMGTKASRPRKFEGLRRQMSRPGLHPGYLAAGAALGVPVGAVPYKMAHDDNRKELDQIHAKQEKRRAAIGKRVTLERYQPTRKERAKQRAQSGAEGAAGGAVGTQAAWALRAIQHNRRLPKEASAFRVKPRLSAKVLGGAALAGGVAGASGRLHEDQYRVKRDNVRKSQGTLRPISKSDPFEISKARDASEMSYDYRAWATPKDKKQIQTTNRKTAASAAGAAGVGLLAAGRGRRGRGALAGVGAYGVGVMSGHRINETYPAHDRSYAKYKKAGGKESQWGLND